MSGWIFATTTKSGTTGYLHHHISPELLQAVLRPSDEQQEAEDLKCIGIMDNSKFFINFLNRRKNYKKLQYLFIKQNFLHN